jgi:hypothetical protein
MRDLPNFIAEVRSNRVVIDCPEEVNLSSEAMAAYPVVSAIPHQFRPRPSAKSITSRAAASTFVPGPNTTTGITFVSALASPPNPTTTAPQPAHSSPAQTKPLDQANFPNGEPN